MKELLIDTLLDTAKLCPFLFLSFGIIAYFELQLKVKSVDLFNKTLRMGPLVGGLLGIIPQCGFSVLTANLYASGIVTTGTLISVLLSTSDELLPILISSNVPFCEILQIILIKLAIAVFVGFLIDYLIKDRKTSFTNVTVCTDSCCNESILASAFKHTLQTASYILLTTLIINLAIFFIGEHTIGALLNSHHLLSPMIASFIGLIPNCAASVIISELYLNGIINLANCIAGLLSSCGVALVVLFRVNRDCLKDNIEIVILIYVISTISGLLLNLLFG